jgi:hypothetical protein
MGQHGHRSSRKGVPKGGAGKVLPKGTDIESLAYARVAEVAAPGKK